DDFPAKPGGPPAELSERPFVAALPKRLLSHDRGGALAVIGHVARASGFSFMRPGGSQLLPFRNALGRILAGETVGYAMTDFNERYAALSTDLANLQWQVSVGATIPDEELVPRWIERNDAQNYVVLGDPAVALRPA